MLQCTSSYPTSSRSVAADGWLNGDQRRLQKAVSYQKHVAYYNHFMGPKKRTFRNNSKPQPIQTKEPQAEVKWQSTRSCSRLVVANSLDNM